MKHILLIFLLALSSSISYSQSVNVFDTPGAGTFTVPSCVTRVTVAVYGGGGGGGGSNTSTIGGGGGGAGGYAEWSFGVTEGDVISYSVGAGGNGGIPGWNGGSGTKSTCTVGAVTITGNKGIGGAGENTGGAGGAGGTGTNGGDPNGGNGGNAGGPNGGTGGTGGGLDTDGSIGTNYGSGGGAGGKRGVSNTSGAAGADGAVVITYGNVYRTISSGNWNDPTIWDPTYGQPPQNLPCGDTMIISPGHIVNATNHIFIYGVFWVEAGGQYGTGENKSVSITGDQFTGYPQPFPLGVHGRMHNDGLVDITGNFHNDGFSYNSGQIFCTKYHNDFYQCNSGAITAPTEFNNHGGKIECCGNIYTNKLKLKKQTSDKGYTFYFSDGGWGAAGQATEPTWGESVVLCQNICNVANDGDPASIEAPAGGMTGLEVLLNSDIQESYTENSVPGVNEVTFCGLGPLPVELASLTGVNQGDDNIITWVTSSEENNDYFTIERSINGFDWEYVGVVEGSGTTIHSRLYELIDNNPYFPVTYYRLSQTDFDGYVTFFDVISVNRQDQVDGIVSALFPNPASDYATFTYNGTKASGVLTVQFLNELGQVVKQLEQKAQKAIPTSIKTDDLTAGVYQVVFIQGNDRSVQKLSIIK